MTPSQWEGSRRPHAAVFEQLTFNQVLARLESLAWFRFHGSTCAHLLATRAESGCPPTGTAASWATRATGFIATSALAIAEPKPADFQRHKYPVDLIPTSRYVEI